MGKHALQDVDGFVSRKDFFFVDPRVLVVEPDFNPRQDIGLDDEDQDFKASIIANGVEVPLKVQKGRDKRLVIREGHRRHWACMEAIKEGHDIKAVPVILVDRNMSEDRALYMALNCNTGRQLKPLEEARAFERLVKRGHQVKEIAERVGRSLVYVYERLKLVDITPEVRTAIEDGKISLRDAAKAVSKSGGDPDKQNRVLKAEKPKPVQVRWNKKDNKLTLKNWSGEGFYEAEFNGWLFSAEWLEWFEEQGLDIRTIKFSILPKNTKKGTEESCKNGTQKQSCLDLETIR